MSDILGMNSALLSSKDDFTNESFIDNLTGFYNQLYMDNKIKNYVEEDSKVSILLFDITNFKNINNFYGHDIGDEVLKHFSTKLRELFEGVPCELVRQQSDKFFVIIEDCLDDIPVVTFANNLLLSLSDGFSLNDGQNITLKCTYGIARLPLETNNSNELLELAELSNFNSKDNSIYEVD